MRRNGLPLLKASVLAYRSFEFERAAFQIGARFDDLRLQRFHDLFGESGRRAFALRPPIPSPAAPAPAPPPTLIRRAAFLCDLFLACAMLGRARRNGTALLAFDAIMVLVGDRMFRDSFAGEWAGLALFLATPAASPPPATAPPAVLVDPNALLFGQFILGGDLLALKVGFFLGLRFLG
ncbi:MAG: hypothetical protein WAJ91_01000, partial [Rhodoplanes sp.]